jgi:hypothetical protein
VKIISVIPTDHYKLIIQLDNGLTGTFDVTSYLNLEAFEPLSSPEEFKKIINGQYFVEWDCGADLSLDTIEAHIVF